MLTPKYLYPVASLALSLCIGATTGCSDDTSGPSLPCPAGGLKTAEQIADAAKYKCDKPQICPDISFLTFPAGGYIISQSAAPYSLGVGLTNCSTGNQKLEIQQILVYGDKNCHFSKPEMEADGWTIDPGPNNTKQMQMTWKPTTAGQDNIEVAIITNAENFPTLIVPGCAIACEASLDQGVAPDAGWGDSGSTSAGCGTSPATCPDVEDKVNAACNN